MAVTIKDIVEISGYSRGTVDRALNNKSRISKKTREKILAIAKELDYRPDFVARSLVKGVTMTIGVVVFDIQNRYFALLLNSIEKEAKANGYSIIIMLQENDKDLEVKVLKDLVDRRVDGIILCPVNKGIDFCHMVKTLPMPVVTIGNHLAQDIHCIRIDEEKAAIEATKYIVSKGYSKIIFVCPYIEDGVTENIFVHDERYKGFEIESNNHPDIEFEIISERNSLESIADTIDVSKKTAFLCSGDMLALDIIKSLRVKNILAPENYGIMGFDDLDILDYITPALTTIHNPVEEIGSQAFKLVEKLMNEKDENFSRKLPYHLVEGKTI